MTSFSESTVEAAALAWLESAGWSVRNGASIAPGEPAAERTEDGFVAPAPVNGLPERFRAASRRKIEN